MLKVLEENKGKELLDIDLGSYFLDINKKLK